MIDTVTLITRQVDLAALALLLLIPYAGEVSARLPAPAEADSRGRVRQVLLGTLAASPILLVMAVLFLRHSGVFVKRSEPCRRTLASLSMIAAFPWPRRPLAGS